MADHEHFTPEQIIKAFKEENGFLVATANNLRCSVVNLYNYMKRYPEIREALDDIKLHRVERAENILWELIEEKNVASVIFFLKTQAKDRYSETKILAGDKEQPLQVEGKIEIRNLSNKELDQLIEQKLNGSNPAKKTKK